MMTCSDLTPGGAVAGSVCVYTCKGDLSMGGFWGTDIETTCLEDGLWSHMSTTSLSLTMPRCAGLSYITDSMLINF